MGAKTWMLVGSDGDAREILKSKPKLDREATAALAARLFPGEKLELIGEETLSYTNPPDDELFIAAFPGLSIVAAIEFGIDYPSQLPASFLDQAVGRTIHLHAMHSVVDWFAFAVWQDGKLRRALSLSPDSGILEDIGERLPFEAPFWEGQNPVFDPPGEGPSPADLDPVVVEEPEDEYPFPFHPLELGEAALLDFFGYQLEGTIDPSWLDPEDIPLLKYRRPRSAAALAPRPAAPAADKPWWKIW